MRLARDAANDAIHDSTPRSAVEGSDIAPHRRVSHESFLHRCDQMGDREGFPLHQQDASSCRACELNTEVEASAAGTETDEIEAFGM